jgi:hypothetical protein
MAARSRSLEQLATVMGRTPTKALALLLQMEQAGLVVLDGDEPATLSLVQLPALENELHRAPP